MSQLTRRGALKLGAAAAAVSALSATVPRPAAAADLRFAPEPGAALNVLRWDAFVPGEAAAVPS